MTLGLRARLTAGYMLMAALSVLAVGVFANLFLEARFADYVSQRIAGEKSQVVAALANAWRSRGAWDHDELSVLGMNALEQGFIVQVSDAGGAVVWDARTHNNGMCEQMLATLATAMERRYSSWTPTVREEYFPIAVGDSAVGSVRIGNYGPFWFNDSEVFFLGSLNQLVAVASLAALAVAAALGWLMARRMARPIQRVTATANLLRQGSLDTRAEEDSPVREIAELAAAVNGLGRSLAEQDDLRRRMSTDVSHELRTPLASLQGTLEAMIDGVWPADAARLAGCREEVVRLGRLVGQIENLARAEAAAGELRRVALDLPDFVERACRRQQADFVERGIDFSWRSQAGSLSGDPDKLAQVLFNLLSNAARYTPAGGAVAVEADLARADGADWARIAVRDTGAGIPAADLPHVFERFYRVDPARSGGGSGIGLTIAKSLAQLHGGRIAAESGGPGRGSVFTLWLPAS